MFDCLIVYSPVNAIINGKIIKFKQQHHLVTCALTAIKYINNDNSDQAAGTRRSLIFNNAPPVTW